MQRQLSLEQSPPIAVPLRFFLTAPLFAMAAGLLLMWQGPMLFLSRWSPGTLALTHLITLGFLGMSMVGALIQILHVMAGIDIAHTPSTEKGIHALVAAGTAMLVYGFLSGKPDVFDIALPCLAAGFGWLLAVCIGGIWRIKPLTPSLQAIRLALFGLGVTVTLGIAAGLVFSAHAAFPLDVLANLHAGWGMLTWIGLLVVGVSYQIVPMFQVTELYPAWMMRALARCVMAGLTLWALAYPVVPEPLRDWSQLPLALSVGAYALFALTTLLLIWRRKRPQTQASTMFWYLAMASVLAAVLLWPFQRRAEGFPLLLGILILIGFAYSLVNGMLYKIVPFLVWYHLQEELAPLGRRAPNAREIIADKYARRQFWLHTGALFTMAASVPYPQLAHIAGAVLFADAGSLSMLLFKAERLYRRSAARLS